ncbi:ABC transporter permease [Desulfosarcina ovata]|uniref:ABC transporter permease n=1 Tax=Desulfosarcina ovata subsp. ovata TaxID=2752305 RepID=A0A5K8AIT9_9BACT|nr:ABC transporter permease [Desulfosarcina ovata]BBO91800.1 ABC transporter permease [Desulfosarcina ovata subsp. ovata]
MGSSADQKPFRYPLKWRVLDRAEAIASMWPRRWAPLTGYLFLIPSILLVFVLVIGLAYLFENSFHELDLTTYRLKAAFELVNYKTALTSPTYQSVILRSLGASVLVTVITACLAFPYAYVMVRAKTAFTRKFLLISLFLPFFIGQVVRAYGWLIILGKEGLLNQLATSLGFPQINMIYNFPAVILGLVQYMLPFAVLLMAPAITAIGEDVELASESLGANWIQTFRHVVIPMAMPGIVGASVVLFTLTLTDFAMPEILGGGTMDFIANSIYDSFFLLSNPGLGAALSMFLVTLGSLVVTVIFSICGTGTLGFSRRTH